MQPLRHAITEAGEIASSDGIPDSPTRTGPEDTVGNDALFLKKSLDNFKEVGSIAPTSRWACRAMTSELARRQHLPTRILEVGAGTGPVTDEIIRVMGPKDELVSVELLPDYCTVLRERFRTEPRFRAVADRCQVIEGDILNIDQSQRFDVAIVSIPFNNLDLETTRAIFEAIRGVLRPGAVCSYIEYSYLRYGQQAWRTATGGGDPRAEFLTDLLRRYSIRRDFIVANVPPTWVHHLVFEGGPVEEAATLGDTPVPTHTQLPFGAAIDRDGTIMSSALALGAWALKRQTRNMGGLWKYLWAIPAALAAGSSLFFRDPDRTVPEDPRSVVAASDGKVLAVEEMASDETMGVGPWLRISVFLSLFDVHINRAPVAGRVDDVITRKGSNAPAMTARAEHNVSKTTVFQTEFGRVGVVQRTGMVARRIVQRHRPSSLLAKGERMGLIRFGSRTDVYLPLGSTEVKVRAEDVVRGGETVIARFR